MSERAPFLNTAYSAYYHRERPPEDEELTRVGPGTPCGEYLRRFWQPVILSNELGELPRRLRILGEDLVAFRDKSGAIGLLELHCPHRGTSLEFGLIGDKGIRCCYHGWLFDCDGTILETPGEPADSTLKDRLFHGAYPVHEHKGWSLPIWDRLTGSPISRSSTPTTCPATGRSPARRPCGNATGCRSKKTAWTRRIWRSCTPCPAARALPTISGHSASGTGWRPRSAWSISTPAAKTTGYGCGSPIFYPAEHPSVPAQRRPDGIAQLGQPADGDDLGGAARRHPHDADRLLPRAGGQGVSAGRRFWPGCEPAPTKNGSAFPATMTRRSAFMAGWRGTGSNISPPPTAASS